MKKAGSSKKSLADVAFNVRFRSVDVERLDALSSAWEMSRAQVLRVLLRNASEDGSRSPAGRGA